MRRTVVVSLSIGLAASLAVYVLLWASDEIFQSRLLPWVVPLIEAQKVGLMLAYHFFSCQKEGFDTGCEPYKVIPSIIAGNALTYSIVLLPVIHLWRKISFNAPAGSNP